MVTAKKKKGFLDGYKTYDPDVEGYGSPEDWTGAFRIRMGIDEAQEVLGNEDPWKILDVNSNETWDTIKKAYRKLIMKYHPDHNPSKRDWATQMTRKVIAAFVAIKARRGK